MKHGSYASHWGKSGRLSYKDFLAFTTPSSFQSIWRMTVHGAGSGESNLKSGVHESLPSELCREGICQPLSVSLWHIYGLSDGSLIPTGAAFAPSPHPHWRGNYPTQLCASIDRWKHAMSSCHSMASIALFQIIEGSSMWHLDDHLAVVLCVYQYSTEATHSFSPSFSRHFPRVSSGLVTHPVTDTKP